MIASCQQFLHQVLLTSQPSNWLYAPPPDSTYYSKFNSNEHLQHTQSLSNIFFCTLPPADPRGDKQTYGSKSNSVDNYGGSIQAKHSPDSIFDEKWQAKFREELNNEMDEDKPLYRGFQSLTFAWRVQNSEGDAQDSILTNVIDPLLEAVQSLAPPGYRIAVATHATQKPASDEEASNSGIVDHIIFAIPTLSHTVKGTKYQLQSDLSVVDDVSRWIALAVIECKGFNMVEPQDYSHLFLDPDESEAGFSQELDKLAGRKLNVRYFIPQLRKYSYLFYCDNLILSDYSHSVAFDIPHQHAAEFGCPIQAQECGGGVDGPLKLVNGRMEGSPLSYGFRCTLFYMIWHSLERLSEKKKASASNTTHSRSVASGSGGKRNNGKGKEHAH